MIKSLHLIDRTGDGLKLISKAKNFDIVESGEWKIDSARINDLIGAEVHIHTDQKSDSYDAGIIVAITLFEDRKLVRYVVDKNLIGLPSPTSGWSHEKCYVNLGE